MDEATGADYTKGYIAFRWSPAPPMPGREGIDLLASRGLMPALWAGLAICVAGAVSQPATAAADPAPAPTVAASTARDFASDIAAARDLQRKGRAREAIALLALDHKLDPGNRDVTVAFAQIYSYAGQQGQAIALLDTLLAATPDDVDARIVLAQAYAFNHDYGAAEAQYQKALTAAPDDSDAKVGLAQTYAFEGRYTDAKALYAAVLAKDPKNFDALTGLAGAESFSGDYRKARADYQSVLDVQPDNSDALVGLATVDYWLNDLPAAIALDHRALALDPADPDANDLRRQLDLKTSPQIISTLTTSSSTDGSTRDYRVSERFFTAPTTAIGLVEDLYTLSNASGSAQTHRFGIVGTFQASSRFGVDLSLLGSKYAGVGAVTDSALSMYGGDNGLTYGLSFTNGGVDGSVAAAGGRISPSQQSALVRINAVTLDAGYTRKASTMSIAQTTSAYNDGNRFHEELFDLSHQFGIGANTTVTPDLGIRSAGFSNTYNDPTVALSPGYYNYQSQRDTSLGATFNRQMNDRLSVGAVGTLGFRQTVVLTYVKTGPLWNPHFVSIPKGTGSLPFQRVEPYFDYEGDRFSVAGALYVDHYPGGAPLIVPYSATTVDITFSIRLP